MRKPSLRRGRTISLGRTKPAARHPILREHHDPDIAIVGGGMIAEAFTRNGVRDAVIEASRVAQGGTARHFVTRSQLFAFNRSRFQRPPA